MIVLYPDVGSSFKNLAGCWDTFGYSGSDYITKASPQGSAIIRMIEQMTEPLYYDFGY
jgi:hypothetical protein